MKGDNNSKEDFSMSFRKRGGKTPLTEFPTLPPAKRAKSGKKNILTDELSFMNDAKLAYARKRYISLAKLNVGTEKFVNEDDLDEVGVKDRVVELIERGKFGGLWRLRGEIWEEIVKELLATMIINHDKEMCWVCLRGRPLQFSFHDFAEACGVYEGVGNEVGTIVPETFWNGGMAAKMGMKKNKFWSELCGQQGLKFVGGVSKITGVKDVSIKIIHRWLVKSICGRNAKDGAVSERELTCLFAMVKGVDFDLAKLLISQMEANLSKNKGEIYGGLYLTHFAKKFHESLPGMTIKPMEACTNSYLKGRHPGNMTTKDATTSGQPSDEIHRPRIDTRRKLLRNKLQRPSTLPGKLSSYRPVMNHLPRIKWNEMEEVGDMPEFEPPPTVTPSPKHTREGMRNKIKEKRAYDFRREQMVQRVMLKNIMDNVKWMKEETIDFFKKTGHCFSKPPPTCEGPPEINEEEFFRNFKSEDKGGSIHQGGGSTNTPLLVTPPSSAHTVLLDDEE